MDVILILLEIIDLQIIGHHIRTRRISTYGSQTLILHNDILQGRRYGDIYINTKWDTIDDNYFEDHTRQGCAVYTVNAYGTNIINNRIDSPSHNSVVFDLTSISPSRICGTKINPNNYSVSIKNTPAQTLQSQIGWVTLQTSNNDFRLSIPRTPGIFNLDNPYFTSQNGFVCNPLLLSIAKTTVEGTAIDNSDPFLRDEDSNLYYFKKAEGSNLSWRFQWRTESMNPYLLHSKTKKVKGIRILYKSTRENDYGVVKYDNTEYWKGFLNNLIADNNFHYHFIDLSNKNIIINGTSAYVEFELAAYNECKIFELELVLEDYQEEQSI